MKNLIGHNNPPEPLEAEALPSRRALITGAAAVAAYAAMPRAAKAAGRIIFRRPWQPGDLNSAGTNVIAAWWRAQDYALMTDDGSGLISNWPDLIGRLALTATTTARGTWSKNSFNGAYPGITLDGVANCYTGSVLTTLPTGSTAGSVWFVGTQTLAAAGTMICYGDTAGATGRLIRGNLSFRGVASDIVTSNVDLTTTLTSSPCIVAAEFSGTTLNGWINGNAFSGNPTTIATLATGTTKIRIGAQNAGAGSSFFGGALAETGAVRGTLATLDRQRMEGFIAWKYAMASILPASHPFKGAPP